MYTTGLEKSMKGSKSVIDYADGLHYKCHKISIKHVASYTYILLNRSKAKDLQQTHKTLIAIVSSRQ